MHRLFVYGSLAPGRLNAHVLADVPGRWEPATVRGTLRNEGWGAELGHPGIVLAACGDEVEGLLFSSEHLPAHWARLDAFEGEGYERVMVEAKPAQGGSVDAHVYVLREAGRRAHGGRLPAMHRGHSMNAIHGEMLALAAADVPAIEVGPGCRRRDLPSAAGVRAWIVEMDPGSQWPHVDQHPTGEDVYVLEGEMIEGEQHYPAGSYLHFLPGSSHQPRTRTGLRLFGFNTVAR
jgi:gamma-glutamylcyclotransferase (GGCT)/AIG2-like uncharacterized protein YtfP